MNSIIRVIKSIFVFIVIAIGSMCIIGSGGGGGGESDNGNDSTVNVPKVTLEKVSGTAGSIVKVSGIDIESCPLSASEIRVGNEIAPALLNDKGETVMMLPLYYDEETKWPDPPTGPQNVKIYCNGKILTTLPDAMTITDLHPAPGTTALLIADYSEIISDFEEIIAVITPNLGLQQQLFDALISAMQMLLNGNSANSLPTMINEIRNDDPEFLALLDAIHAASGAYENIGSFKKLMTDLKIDVNAAASMIIDNETTALASYETISPITQVTPAGITMSANNSVVKRIALPDEALAVQMQLYSTLDLFANQVISDTKTTFGLIFGAFGIVFNKIPAKKTVDIILHILDYSFKHLLVSILPATLEPIVLSLPKTELENSEITNAVIYIKAKNVPAPVTITDMTENILFVLGISGGGEKAKAWINTLKEALIAASSFYLELVNNLLKDQSEIDYDLDLFTIIPQIHFEASGHTRELYTLYPLPGGSDSKAIKPLTDTLEWRADTENWGRATLFLETVPQAFGDKMILSNKVPVTVGGFALILEQNAISIPEGESTIVGVKLSDSPQENQNISVYAKYSSGDEDISVISVHPLIFNDSNWETYQGINMEAAIDDDDINGQAIIKVWADINFIDAETITIEENITVDEEDALEILTDMESVTIAEDSVASLMVRLNKEPDSQAPIIVSVMIENGDPDITITSALTFQFDSSNWDIYQIITLYAQPDLDVDNRMIQIKISADVPEVEDKYVNVYEQDASNKKSLESLLGGEYISINGMKYDNFELYYDRSYGTLNFSKIWAIPIEDPTEPGLLFQIDNGAVYDADIGLQFTVEIDPPGKIFGSTLKMLQYDVPSNPETPFGANITVYIGEIEVNLDVSLLDNIQIGVSREFLNEYLEDSTQFEEPQEIAVAVQMPTAVSIGIESYSLRFNIE